MTDNNAWKYRAIKEMKWDEERRKKWAEDKKKTKLSKDDIEVGKLPEMNKFYDELQEEDEE